VIWGAHPKGHDWPDLTWREVLALVPLAVATLWLGIYPGPLLAHLDLPVQLILGQGKILLSMGGLP
jgi:NADH:ubiquinone oxidoreductase subunit 4 (subunit M)